MFRIKGLYTSQIKKSKKCSKGYSRSDALSITVKKHSTQQSNTKTTSKESTKDSSGKPNLCPNADHISSDVCISGRDVLAEELELYTFSQLQSHLEDGETNKDGKIILFHPKCEFCEMYFFDIETFVQHMKKSHEVCHVCGKDHPHRYYRDYETLNMHFQKSHFYCRWKTCLEQGFTVFRTEEELEAHYVSIY